VQSIRDRAGGSGGGLQVKVIGAAGYRLDAIKVFANINGSLLLVAALIVLIPLIVIYRPPIFGIIPFFTVQLAEARRAGYLLVEAGETINTRDAEAFVLHDERTPQDLRIRLSEVFVRMRQATRKTAVADRSPALPVARDSASGRPRRPCRRHLPLCRGRAYAARPLRRAAWRFR
jgi:hypothetical protein